MSREILEKPKRLAKEARATRSSLKTGEGKSNIVGVKKLDELAARIRTCVECPLHVSRTLAVPGAGKAKPLAMIIGEGPGKDEDKAGLPFVGSAGRYLDHVLEGTNITREDFFVTNVVKCRPPGNRAPKKLEAETCTSLYLFKQIELLDPPLIVLLGTTAAKFLLGAQKIEDLRGNWIERDGRRYLATYHPAIRFYREDLAAKLKEDFHLLRDALLRLKAS